LKGGKLSSNSTVAWLDRDRVDPGDRLCDRLAPIEPAS
jgi:hypothetical protein